MAKLGIKETKELFDLGFAIAKAGKDATADGRVNIFDIGLVIPVFGKVMPAIEDVALVPRELGDIDEAEAQELLEYAKTRLGTVVDSEQVVRLIAAYIKAGLAVAEAISLTRGA